MKKETKEEIKKNLATGASTAAGATAGVVIGASVSTAEAQTTPEPEPEPEPIPEPEPTPTPEPIHVIIDNPASEIHHNTNGGNDVIFDNPINPVNPVGPVNDIIVDPVNPDPIVRVVDPGNSEAHADVVGYDRITAEDGSQIDVAVVNVNGQEYGIADINLDGQADLVGCDLNNNGVMDQGEVRMIEPGALDMQTLQDAAGFDPLYAQNDIQDYTNDADVDTYMA